MLMECDSPYLMSESGTCLYSHLILSFNFFSENSSQKKYEAFKEYMVLEKSSGIA